jgi:hypothetical protein
MNLLIPEYYLSRLRIDTVNVWDFMQKSKGFGTGVGYGRFLLKLGARDWSPIRAQYLKQQRT